MKRTLTALGIVLATALVVGFGLVWARPDLLPTWARPGAGARHADAGSGLYCKEHGVPEKFCTLCHEALAGTLMLCKEHGGIPEDICTLCHPEVEEEHNLRMCPQGHGLPEEFCVECGKVPSASVRLPDDGWCVTHNTPESLCEECLKETGDQLGDPEIAAAGPNAEARICRDPLPLVRFASARLARQIGIETIAAVEESHDHTLVANAETAYDANNYAEVTPRVSGFLFSVDADLGSVVRRGERLAVVDSAEVGGAKMRYIAALSVLRLAEVTLERTKALLLREAVPARRELEDLTATNQAQAEMLDAEQRLRNLGFDNEALARNKETGGAGSRIDVVAPIDGTVVARHAVKGEAVQATTELFAIADTSRMWLWIDIYESDIGTVKVGQSVSYAISGTDADDSGHAFVGEVTWVGSEVNPTTRTTRIRAELINASGRLRANQFGRAEIRVGDEHKAVVVPKAAVQRKDQTDVVFLPEEEGVYRPRRVVTKPTNRNDVVEVTWGLEPGQRVVTKGAFLLKTEIMKGAIGAGCCE